MFKTFFSVSTANVPLGSRRLAEVGRLVPAWPGAYWDIPGQGMMMMLMMTIIMIMIMDSSAPSTTPASSAAWTETTGGLTQSEPEL